MFKRLLLRLSQFNLRAQRMALSRPWKQNVHTCIRRPRRYPSAFGQALWLAGGPQIGGTPFYGTLHKLMGTSSVPPLPNPLIHRPFRSSLRAATADLQDIEILALLARCGAGRRVFRQTVCLRRARDVGFVGL